MAFVWLIACLTWSPVDDPHRDALARYGAGVLMQSRDELIAAKTQFEAAAKQEPNAAEPLRALFRVYLDLGKYTAAVRTGRRVLELDPNDYRMGLALGRVLLDGKQPREAAEVLTRASQAKSLANDPSTAVDVYSNLAKAHEAHGDLAAAETALIALTEIHRKRAAEIRKANVWTVVEQSRIAGLAFERLGLLRIKRMKPVEAGEAFFEAEKVFSGPGQFPTGAVRVHRNLARAFAATGDHAKALESFRMFVDAANGYEPLEEYYLLLLESETGAKIAEELNRVVKRTPSRPGNDWFRIVAEFQSGAINGPSTRAKFTELAQDPAEPARFALVVRTLPIETLVDWYDELALAAEGQPGVKGDPKAGQLLRPLADAIRESPVTSKAFLARVMMQAKAGQARAAGTYEYAAWLAERAGKIEYVETALQFVSKSAPVWERIRPLVMLYERQRRWKDVVAVCDPLLRGGRNVSVQAIYTSAYAYAELGQTRQALDLVNRLTRDDRLFAEGKLSVRMQQARIFVVAGEAKRALELTEKLFEDAANPSEIRRLRVVLADAYFALKDVNKAEEQLRAILEEDPDDALALNNLGYNLADRGLKLAEAEALCRRAVEQDRDDRRRSGDAAPASGTYLDSLGWALFRRGKLDEAKAVFESAVALPDGSGDPTVWDHLGDVYFKQGDSEKAKQAWEKAAAGYPETHTGRQGGRLDEVKKKMALVR